MTVDDPVTTRSSARGRSWRFVRYLAEMFPPQVMVPFAASHFLAFWFSLQALAGQRPVRFTSTSIRGIATVTLLLLLMRTYDELKDVATDIALARAGDPWYRDRVLVTGAVRIEDVQTLRWIVTAALIGLNVRPDFGWATLAFWVVFGVMWLSFHWFFWPKMSQNLLLAFATHNPISLLIAGYVVALFADAYGTEALDGPVVPLLLLLGLWLPFAAWETSRKIRAPEDETAYRTYSRVLGWKTAAILPAFFVALSAWALVIVARAAGVSAVFPTVIVAAAAVVAIRCALFRLAPSRRHADLKPWAVLFAAIANAGLAASMAASRGLAW